MITLDNDILEILLSEYRRNVSGIVDLDDFREDVNRFFYIARQLRRYSNSGSLNVRLLLNHFQLIYNVFGNTSTSVLIEYISKDLHPDMFGVLYFLYRLPQRYNDQVNKDIIKIINRDINAST